MPKNKLFFLHIIVVVSIFLFSPLLTINSFGQKKFIVVVDAGHGGKDPGARGSFSEEKDINLAIAMKLGEKIEKNNADVTVLYTRKTDVYLTVAERPKYANDMHADLFISIHTNSSPSSVASGVETFSLGTAKTKENLDIAMRENSVILLEDDYKQKYQGFDPKSIESYIMFEFMQDKYMEYSIKLASLVQEKVTGKGNRKDRGVRQAGFLVLKNTAMPSVLVEIGFISNKEEEKYINSKEGQEQLATDIYAAFNAFKHEYDKKSGNVSSSTASTTASTESIPAPVETKTKHKTKKESSKKEFAKKDSVKSARIDSVKIAEPIVKKEEPSKKIEKINEKTNVNVADTIYKVQIFAGKDLLKKNSDEFKGLKNVDYFTENKMYKYTYGETSTYNEIVKMKNEANKHFPNAFIITFVKGVKLPVKPVK
jgi:N-acetylmuramoyl-L-alanine amidase